MEVREKSKHQGLNSFSKKKKKKRLMMDLFTLRECEYIHVRALYNSTFPQIVRKFS